MVGDSSSSTGFDIPPLQSSVSALSSCAEEIAPPSPRFVDNVRNELACLKPSSSKMADNVNNAVRWHSHQVSPSPVAPVSSPTPSLGGFDPESISQERRFPPVMDPLTNIDSAPLVSTSTAPVIGLGGRCARLSTNNPVVFSPPDSSPVYANTSNVPNPIIGGDAKQMISAPNALLPTLYRRPISIRYLALIG